MARNKSNATEPKKRDRANDKAPSEHTAVRASFRAAR